MGIRFKMSHQYVGLNRVGKYMEPCSAGVSPASHSGKQAGGTPALPNEKWRRITNIVGRKIETFAIKQRKRGIRALVNWMERKLKSDLNRTQRTANGTANRRDAEAQRKIGIVGEWGTDIEKWGGVKHAGRSVESLCVELGITHAKLSGLMKEGFGLSAGEILDGIKVRGLKDFLVGQLGEAARKLWGMPGSFAEVRCMFHCATDVVGLERRERPTSSVLEGARGTDEPANGRRHIRGTDIRGTNGGAKSPAHYCKRSHYFRTRPSEFFGVLPGDEVRIRISELLGALDQLREEKDFGIQNLALRLGFDSAEKFRKACWTVMGRSLEQLEKILAHEIVDYYLAAEDRKLREIAMAADGNYGKDGNHVIYCAREIYGAGDDAPESPFLDRWSANEFAKPDWLTAMQEKFG